MEKRRLNIPVAMTEEQIEFYVSRTNASHTELNNMCSTGCPVDRSADCSNCLNYYAGEQFGTVWWVMDRKNSGNASYLNQLASTTLSDVAVCYHLPDMSQISSTTNVEEMVNAMHFALALIENGAVPFDPTTEEILENIEMYQMELEDEVARKEAMMAEISF